MNDKEQTLATVLLNAAIKAKHVEVAAQAVDTYAKLIHASANRMEYERQQRIAYQNDNRPTVRGEDSKIGIAAHPCCGGMIGSSEHGVNEPAQ